VKVENLFKGETPEKRRVNMARFVREWKEAWE